MDIGRALLEIREEKGLKQEAVALDAGTNSGYLSRIENGIRSPALGMLENLAAALGSTVTEIVSKAESYDAVLPSAQIGTENDEFLEIQQQLNQQFHELTPGNQEIALELLRALSRTQKPK